VAAGFGFLHQYTPRYSWNIAKVGVKHQSVNPQPIKLTATIHVKKVNTSFKNVWRTWEPALPTLLADLMFFCPLCPIGPTNFKNSVRALQTGFSMEKTVFKS
jgi:hypothetical protein